MVSILILSSSFELKSPLGNFTTFPYNAFCLHLKVKMKRKERKEERKSKTYSLLLTFIAQFHMGNKKRRFIK